MVCGDFIKIIPLGFEPRGMEAYKNELDVVALETNLEASRARRSVLRNCDVETALSIVCFVSNLCSAAGTIARVNLTSVRAAFENIVLAVITNECAGIFIVNYLFLSASNIEMFWLHLLSSYTVMVYAQNIVVLQFTNFYINSLRRYYYDK